MSKELMKITSGTVVCTICLVLTTQIPSWTFVLGVVAGSISTLINVAMDENK